MLQILSDFWYTIKGGRWFHRICGTEAPALSYAQGYLPSERAKRTSEASETAGSPLG